jgi:hypothetical protein
MIGPPSGFCPMFESCWRLFPSHAGVVWSTAARKRFGKAAGHIRPTRALSKTTASAYPLGGQDLVPADQVGFELSNHREHVEKQPSDGVERVMD